LALNDWIVRVKGFLRVAWHKNFWDNFLLNNWRLFNPLGRRGVLQAGSECKRWLRFFFCRRKEKATRVVGFRRGNWL